MLEEVVMGRRGVEDGGGGAPLPPMVRPTRPSDMVWTSGDVFLESRAVSYLMLR